MSERWLSRGSKTHRVVRTVGGLGHEPHPERADLSRRLSRLAKRADAIGTEAIGEQKRKRVLRSVLFSIGSLVALSEHRGVVDARKARRAAERAAIEAEAKRRETVRRAST